VEVSPQTIARLLLQTCSSAQVLTPLHVEQRVSRLLYNGLGMDRQLRGSVWPTLSRCLLQVLERKEGRGAVQYMLLVSFAVPQQHRGP
jgi:hypothetical protein